MLQLLSKKLWKSFNLESEGDQKKLLAGVVAKAGYNGEESGTRLMSLLQSKEYGHGTTQVFNILYSHTISLSPKQRIDIMEDPALECRMISHVESDVVNAIKLLSKEKGEGTLTCPICKKGGMTEVEMWHHLPMFHCNMKKVGKHLQCPSCGSNGGKPLLVHFHDAHAPPGSHIDSHPPVTLYSFGLCVIQRKSDKKFLVVQEFCNQGYWLPGGGIDPSEQPAAAAKRECMEEAGVDVELTGVLRVEVTPMPHYTRSRYIFYGHPKDDNASPKTIPDFESVGACWVSVEEVLSGEFRLRGSEPADWFQYVAKGGQIVPMSFLTLEGAEVQIPK